jgi:hypothetical protein
VVDRQNFFLFQPLVCRSRPVRSSVEIAIPLGGPCAGDATPRRARRGGGWISSETVQVEDLPNGESRSLEYDVLAVAAGSRYSYWPRRVGAMRPSRRPWTAHSICATGS